MQEGETLKAYSDRYWEMYNELDGNFDDVAISTFKSGLPTDHSLRKSLTGKPVTSVCLRIDKYKRVEEDQLQGKGKEKVTPQKGRDFRSDRYNNKRLRRDFVGQFRSANTRSVNAVFREPVHQVLEKIKNEPFFKRPNKMVGESLKRNKNLYSQYHQDNGHTTEDCRNLWSHLEQLVREGKLRHLLNPSSGHQGQANQEPWRDASLRPPIGMTNVMFATSGRMGSCPSRLMSVARLPADDSGPESKRHKSYPHSVLSFSEEDKIGTLQPHDDALVITFQIGGYDVKRVMVHDGSRVEIMYPDLYKGLGLKLEDLTPYSSPLMSFYGKIVMPKGQIRLPVQTGPEIVEVNFIVVDTYSPYIAIVARPWLHTLGAIASTLHQKVKFSFKGQVLEIRGCQGMARECLVAVISHRLRVESSTPVEESS
nr:uncharacterized protein LOC112029302 [Quercus suber]